MVRARSLALLLAFVAAAAASSMSCSKKSAEETPARPAPIPAQEVERGRKACDTYVTRVCECAKTQPTFEDECAMAPARTQALELNIDLMLNGGGLTKEDVQAVKVEARKVIGACFEDMLRLDDAGCPKATP